MLRRGVADHRLGPSASLPGIRRQRESDRLNQMGRPSAVEAARVLSAAMRIRTAVSAAREAITAPTPPWTSNAVDRITRPLPENF